jgi:hypothetical protein
MSFIFQYDRKRRHQKKKNFYQKFDCRLLFLFCKLNGSILDFFFCVSWSRKKKRIISGRVFELVKKKKFFFPDIENGERKGKNLLQMAEELHITRSDFDQIKRIFRGIEVAQRREDIRGSSRTLAAAAIALIRSISDYTSTPQKGRSLGLKYEGSARDGYWYMELTEDPSAWYKECRAKELENNPFSHSYLAETSSTTTRGIDLVDASIRHNIDVIRRKYTCGVEHHKTRYVCINNPAGLLHSCSYSDRFGLSDIDVFDSKNPSGCDFAIPKDSVVSSVDDSKNWVVYKPAFESTCELLLAPLCHKEPQRSVEFHNALTMVQTAEFWQVCQHAMLSIDQNFRGTHTDSAVYTVLVNFGSWQSTSVGSEIHFSYGHYLQALRKENRANDCHLEVHLWLDPEIAAQNETLKELCHTPKDPYFASMCKLANGDLLQDRLSAMEESLQRIEKKLDRFIERLTIK